MILPGRQAGERLGGAAALVALGSFLLFTAIPLLRGRLWYAALAALGLLAAASIVTRRAQAIQLSMLCVLAPACAWLLPDWVIWPFPYGLALLILAVALRLSPALRGAMRWLRRGRLGRTEALLITGAIATSSTALLGWFLLLRPDLSDLSKMFPPTTSPWLIALGALGFSLCNAAVEEAVWRGFLLEGLSSITRREVAVVLQAISFGVAHIHGFPRGAIGVALAAIYGLMLGIIRLRAEGMLAPWLAHVFADLTIITILATLAF